MQRDLTELESEVLKWIKEHPRRATDDIVDHFPDHDAQVIYGAIYALYGLGLTDMESAHCVTFREASETHR